MIYRILLTSCLMMFALQGVTFAEGGGLPASAEASGEGIIVTGPNPYNFESKQPINGTISINVNNLGDRGSPLQNIDEVMVKAKFSTSDSDYEVSITEPMINHINGKDPTWFGVGYNQKMHGNTKTGTNKLPEMEPDIAIWGWAEVSKNGKLIHTRVPAHVKVMKETSLKGISLEIGTQEQNLFNTPDAYLHVRWFDVDQLALPDQKQRMREWLGLGGLILLNLWFGWLAVRELPLSRVRGKR